MPEHHEEDEVYTEVPQEERARAISSDKDEDLHAVPEEEIGISIEETPRPWRVARSLLKLREQVNAACPGRNKFDGGLAAAGLRSRCGAIPSAQREAAEADT
ncbi:MAG: hypothetical protein M3177_04655 [Pseudomonadota bacterium]|nr:hypothetical protein [Pseudomonadota bacterium]